MTSGTVSYNTQHVQVGLVGATPTFVDVPGSVDWEPTISASPTPVKADGTTYYTAYASPDLSGDLTWIDGNSAVLGIINGGTVSSSGTAGTVIDRYEQPGVFVPTDFIISKWEPNVDRGHNPDVAGLRTTTPHTSASPASKSGGQESTGMWTASTNATPVGDDPLIIYEWMATAPVFTAGVMPVNLTAPAS